MTIWIKYMYEWTYIWIFLAVLIFDFTYSLAQIRFMKIALVTSDIFVTRKVTYIPRGSAAKTTGRMGLPLQHLKTMSNS